MGGPPPGGSISDAAAGRTAPGELPRGVRDGVLPGQRPVPTPQESEGGGSHLPPPPPPTGQANRFAPRNWRVRTRLVVLVIVPLVATIFGAAARIVQQVGNVKTYDHATTMAAAASPLSTLIDALQDERDISIEMMAFRVQQNTDNSTLTNLTTSMATQRKITDRATAEMLPVLNKIDGSYPADTLSAIANAKANMTGIEALHTAVDGAFSYPVSVFDQYDKVLDSLDNLYEFVAADAGDQQLINDARSLADLGRMTETTSRERGFLTVLAVSSNPNQSQDNLAKLQGLISDLASTRTEFKTIATTQMQQTLSDTVDVGESYTGANQYLQTIDDKLANGGASDNGDQLVPGSVYTQYNSLLDRYKKVRAQQAAALVKRADSLSNSARNTMYVNIGIIVGVLLVVSVATALIARSLVRPLRVLQNTALEIAGNRLPEMVRRLRDADGSEPIEPIAPIALSSTDEVGQVARAFDEVHREAVRLATEQAMLRNNVNAMFTNLSRRSQSLVQRQLRLIDELENAEQDPDQLASLFKLDHLATRMRRNGENLLVLAGEEPGRRWSQPVPLIDVLRAAASEVEQYERVTLRDLPTVEVAGRAVNDVVHLVAELLENATSFSAPETKVSVTGNLLNTGGVMLEIEDSGIGMTPEELDDSNERLANPPVVDVAISRRMGLFVVGRLATRHGIQVRLRRSATGGITALVLVPAALLAGNLSDAPAVGGNRAGTFGDIADTGQLPQLTSTGLPRRPGGAVRAEQRELPSPEEPQGPPNQAPASLPPFGGERVPTASANDGDGWEDVSAAAPPYRGTDATPPGLADLLAETEAMSQGVTPMIREGDPGDPGSSGSHVRPDFVLPEPELDGRLAEALDGTATYDFRPNSAPAPTPPTNPENTGQFRISAGSDDMRLDFRVGEPGPATPPPPPQAPPTRPPLNFSSSFDDLLPNIPDMEHTGEFAAYRETRDERDDLLLPPPNPYAAPGQNPQAPSAGGFGSNTEQMPGSGLNNDLGAELAAGDPFAAPGEVRMTPFGGHVDSGFGDRAQNPPAQNPAAPAPYGGGQQPGDTSNGPAFEAPQFEPPRFEPPQFEAPQFQPPQFEAPQFEAPQFEAPQFEAPQYGQSAPTGDPMASGGFGAPSGTGYGNDAPSFGRRPMGEPLSGPGFDAPQYGEQQSAPIGDGPGDPMAGLRNPFTAPEAPAGTGYGNDAPSFGRRPMGEPLSGPGFDAPQYGEQAPAADLSGSGFQTPAAEPRYGTQPPAGDPSGSGFHTPLGDTMGGGGYPAPAGEPFAAPEQMSASGNHFTDYTDPLTAPIESIPMDPAAHTTSIFNAIESEWFRVRAGEGTAAPQNALEAGAVRPAEPVRPAVPGPRSEPAGDPLAGSGTGYAAQGPQTPAEPVQPVQAATTASTPAPPTAPEAGPAAPTPPAAPAADPFGAPARPAAPHEEPKEPMTDDQSSAGQTWHSPGDDGWKAAEVVKKPVAAGLTPKGLPKRVPRSNLVPGSADGTGAAKVAPSPIPARSAEAVRSRLASFHNGLRQGRDAAGTPGEAQPSDPANPTASDGPAAFGAPEPGKQD
ncbi:putative sensor with HAMP domain [Catenulispora acidiphila DSM 44928]|uniref:histidine kinase n=1 Tax=Catenulispora acidiphila (strain DSM 44928 / JCM 14897 / NBRC 102108 / NRRL B-24433 / ID139908) TaxID=479433 RepID=C7QFA8_CATAD|nr:putative sensor with HAMP domain [Catenulispora acidiphila DSM 44928]